MRIAVYCPERLALSFRRYIEAVLRYLDDQGVTFMRFSLTSPLRREDVDIIWDPCSAYFPLLSLARKLKVPLVTTIHGSEMLDISVHEWAGDRLGDVARGIVRKSRFIVKLRIFGRQYATVITPSQYCRESLSQWLKNTKIVPIYHGVDMAIFTPHGERVYSTKPFYLHISQYAPKKNVHRIIEAYQRLRARSRGVPDLILIVPGDPEGLPAGAERKCDGVRIIREPIGSERLASFYRSAVAFVFPSLNESFGMPILEAMACGCPVITSSVSACPEIAGDAAICVDPRSVEAISGAMEQVAYDSALRERMRSNGLQRACLFTWAKCAERHAQVFKQVLNLRRTEFRDGPV